GFAGIVIFFMISLSGTYSAWGQVRPGRGEKEGPDLLDSLRKIDDERQDTVIYTSRYIRYTNLKQFEDGTITLPLDTSIRNFENYSPIAQPEKPTVNLGGLGLAYRDMLFNPA